MKNELLEKAWTAHGGLDRWNSFDEVHATIVTGGQLFDMKQTPQDSTPREMTVATVERSDGTVVSSRLHPAEHAEGKSVDAAWDALDRAYFNGYALWTYLTTPFLFAMQGFRSEEIAPWKEGTETWRGLRVTFPTEIASHSREQDFYFGSDFLLRRHDYHVEASGGFAAAQYVFDNVTVQGITFPTKRRAYMRDEKLLPIYEKLMVSIDISNLRLSSSVAGRRAS